MKKLFSLVAAFLLGVLATIGFNLVIGTYSDAEKVIPFFDLSEKAEEEILLRIDHMKPIGEYNLDDYDIMYFIGPEKQYVLLRRDDEYDINIIFADNPRKGGRYYYFDAKIDDELSMIKGVSYKKVIYEDRFGEIRYASGDESGFVEYLPKEEQTFLRSQSPTKFINDYVESYYQQS